MTSMLQPPATKLQQAFMECHSDGHTWKRQPGVFDPSEAGPGLRPPYDMHSPLGRRSLCTSCTSERMRWITPSGQAQNKYRYPEGYLHKKLDVNDEPAPSRLEWRRMLVTTFLDQRRRRAS